MQELQSGCHAVSRVRQIEDGGSARREGFRGLNGRLRAADGDKAHVMWAWAWEPRKVIARGLAGYIVLGAEYKFTEVGRH